MNVFLLAMGFDTAGQLYALREALVRQRPRWTVNQMRRRTKWLAYPAQLDYDPELGARLWSAADVIHTTLPGPALRVFRRRRPLVVHHHGSEYRDDRVGVDRFCRSIGATQVVSTLDLMGTPGVEWLPSVVDVDALAAIRPRRHARPTVRIAHAPTDRALKQTAAVVAAVERLVERGLPVELDLIEGVPWQECLARKARADILVDQLELGYGLNAIEAWAMGLPVVAGVTDPDTRDRMIETFGELPFVRANAETLEETLEGLVTDARYRREQAERGRAHVERFHSQRAVVERLEPIYARAVAR